MVRFEGITKAYGETIAVDDLNLEVNQGELVVLIGPSGCGKTTSLKMVNRLIEPTSGRICVRGQDIAGLNAYEYRRSVGYVIQQVGLFPHLTVAANIAVVPTLKRWPATRICQRVDELLHLVGMDPAVYRGRYPFELSGGQQQRIGVLRALAADPDLILMDEPFGALDPITREHLQDELKRIQQQLGKTIIFVTHDMEEAIKLADRIVIMDHGRVVQADAPERLLRNPANQFVADFIGREALLAAPEEVTVGEVMWRQPATIAPHHGLAEALKRMRRQRVDSLLVTGPGERLLGVIRARDLHEHLLRGEHLPVSSLELEQPPVVAPGQDVAAAVSLMAAGAPFVVVTDTGTRDGRLVGLVNRAALISILQAVLGNSGPSSQREVVS